MKNNTVCPQPRVWRYASVIILPFALLVGCEQQGPAERAGEQIDEAVENVGDQLEEAGDKIEEKTE